MLFTHQELDNRTVDRTKRAGTGHRGYHPRSEWDRDPGIPSGEGSGTAPAAHEEEGEADLAGPWLAQLAPVGTAGSVHTC